MGLTEDWIGWVDRMIHFITVRMYSPQAQHPFAPKNSKFKVPSNSPPPPHFSKRQEIPLDPFPHLAVAGKVGGVSGVQYTRKHASLI